MDSIIPLSSFSDPNSHEAHQARENIAQKLNKQDALDITFSNDPKTVKIRPQDVPHPRSQECCVITPQHLSGLEQFQNWCFSLFNH
jgi:hypothetical protein